MGEFLTYLVIAGYFGASVGILVWLASRVRRRGIGGAVMAPIEEIYRPTAHLSRIELQVQNERMLPMPSPEDKGLSGERPAVR